MRVLLLFIAILSLMLMAVGCSESDGAKRHTDVFVASSLSDFAEEAAAHLEAKYPDYDFEVNSGGSQLLEAQIRKGATPGIFMGADYQRVLKLTSDELATGCTELCRNPVVLVVPEDSEITKAKDLMGKGVRIVIAAKEVPVGAVSAKAIRILGIEDHIQENIISRESNVGQVVLKLKQGQADAGFIYETDLKKMKGFREVDIGNSKLAATYGIAILEETKLSRIWFEFMRSDEGKAMLKRHGFQVN